jgi:hypothetical protein
MKWTGRHIVFSLALLAACGGEAPQSIVTPTTIALNRERANMPEWSDWSPAMPLNELNTPTATEGCPNLVWNGQTLLFASNRPGGFGALDLYISYWDARGKRWGAPINLGPTINTAANEQCPLLLDNGMQLLFVSNRPGGLGGLDLWITRIHHGKKHQLSFDPAQNLTVLNSNADDFGPGAYSDHGETVLYFNSNRPDGGTATHDLYVSTRRHSGAFSMPTPAAGLNTPFNEEFAALTKDGLEIFFASDRPGTLGGLDLWHAMRASTSEAWSTPVNLGPAVNSTAAEGRSTISSDGTTLIFHSNRNGSVDLFESTRHHGSRR